MSDVNDRLFYYGMLMLKLHLQKPVVAQTGAGRGAGKEASVLEAQSLKRF